MIYSASYKRPTGCFTHEYLPDVVYCVDGSEYNEYKKVHDQVICLPDGVQGKLSRVWNWILDNAEDDHVVLMDDDVSCIGRWNGNKQKKLSTDEFLEQLELCQLMVEDADVHYWGFNCLSDKGCYREYTPFGFTSYIGGPFQGHYKNDLRYDEDILLKEDYDMTLQILNKYRRTLRFNMLHYICKQHTNKGGCATYRTVEREVEQNNLLIKKWGSKIVKIDTSVKKNQVKGGTVDINPIIKVPIGGV